MRPAVVPDSLIAERRRLGIDGADEMWEGVWHMNDPGSAEHQLLETHLAAALLPIANPRGLLVASEIGVFDPDVPENRDFRVPDIVVFDRMVMSERGVEGGAALVVEIRSPGDESFDKIPFFGQVGVAELLVIDRDTKEVRRWVTDGAGTLTEVAAGADGWHALAAVPAQIRGTGGVLQLMTDGKVQEV